MAAAATRAADQAAQDAAKTPEVDTEALAIAEARLQEVQDQAEQDIAAAKAQVSVLRRAISVSHE